MSSAVAICAIAIAAGSVWGSATTVEARPLLWLCLPVLPVAMLLRRLASPRAALALLACGGCIIGAGLAARAREAALHTALRGHLDAAYGRFVLESPGPEGPHEPVTTRVVLSEDASRAGDVVVLRAAATGIRLGGRWHPLGREGVRLTVAGALSQERMSRWRAGRTVVAPVTFRRPARYLNDGVPDFERDLALEGTSLAGSVKSGLLVDVERPASFIDELAAAVRAHVRRAVSHTVDAYSPVSAAVTTAVLIGDRTGLPDEIRTRLQKAGVYHVIAISGGNIAILAGLVLLVLALAGVRGRTAAAATLLVVTAYAVVVTAGPSVWRATLMAALALAARGLDHRTPVRHAVAVAVAAMVVARPLDVRDAGFILTFGATVALIETARRMRGAAPPLPAAAPVRRGALRRAASVAWTRWALPSIAASAAVEAALMPVSALEFSRVTIAGLVLNLAAVPLMALVQGAGLVVALADGWAIVAGPAAFVAGWSATGIVESARLVELVPWLTWRVPPPDLGLVLAYYAGAGVFLAGKRRLRWAGLAVVVVAGLAIAGGASRASLSRPAAAAASLRLTVFDVGQAESMLLEVPGAAPLLVDAGGAPFGSTGFDVGARVLAPALWARGVLSLDTLLVTHGDPDHVGGADAVIDDFAPGRLWTGIDPPSHGPTRALMTHARRAGLVVSPLRAGEVRVWGLARLRVLNPPAPDWERQQVRNDDSVVLEVLYGDTALLLTGDISEDVERAILPHLSPARHRILKVAHHGSRTSTSAALLRSWVPELAVISCGRGNRFGHPAPEVLARLEEAGARVLRTDQEGQITIETDGDQMKVWTFAGVGKP